MSCTKTRPSRLVRQWFTVLWITGVSLPTFTFAQLPPVPVPIENPITEAKRVLGKILFWDEQLSSDNTVACGTCHAPTAAGGDLRLGMHPGADGVFGNIDDVVGSPGVVRRDSSGFAISDASFGFNVQVTNRAAPNFFGGLWAPQQFWDGRADGQLIDPLDGVTVAIAANGSLEVQALGPILSDVEMAAEGRTWADVTSKLAAATPMVYATAIPTDMQLAITAAPTYGELFAAAFGDAAITPVRIAFAIATYERTLVADQTPFDLGTLTAAQQQGFNAAFGPPGPGGGSCVACHAPPLFTDNTFRNIGVRPPAEDTGREAVTGVAADLGRFKTPTLRNVGLKTTFMHNGSLTTLPAVIAFYAPGGQNSAINLDPAMPVAIAPLAVNNVVDFLQNGLTDPRVAAGTFPFDTPTLTAAGLADFEASLLSEQNVPLPGWALALLSLILLSVVRKQKS